MTPEREAEIRHPHVCRSPMLDEALESISVMREMIIVGSTQLEASRAECKRKEAAMHLAGSALVEVCSWVRAAIKDDPGLLAPEWMTTGEGPPKFSELLADRDAQRNRGDSWKAEALRQRAKVKRLECHYVGLIGPLEHKAQGCCS